MTYVAYGGAEHPHSDYEVLVGCRPHWVQCEGQNIPPNAVPGKLSFENSNEHSTNRMYIDLYVFLFVQLENLLAVSHCSSVVYITKELLQLARSNPAMAAVTSHMEDPS